MVVLLFSAIGQAWRLAFPISSIVPIRAKLVRDDDLSLAVLLHGFSHEFQCTGLIASLCDEKL